MKTLNRSDCAVLTLAMKSRLFDLVSLGQAKEVYLAYRSYWMRRMFGWLTGDAPKVIEVYRTRPVGERAAFLFSSYTIRMRGRFFHPSWGEPIDSEHLAIQLGERVKLVEGGPECQPS